jgi:hypothetical protein
MLSPLQKAENYGYEEGWNQAFEQVEKWAAEARQAIPPETLTKLAKLYKLQ